MRLLDLSYHGKDEFLIKAKTIERALTRNLERLNEEKREIEAEIKETVTTKIILLKAIHKIENFNKKE